MLNKTLANAISKVMYVNNEPFYSLEFKIMSTDGTLTFTPIHVEELHIGQNFIYGYGDQIKVTFPIAMSDYAKLYAIYNKLTAQLIIKRVDINGIKSSKPPILVKKYFVVFDDLKDPTKMMTDVKSRVLPSKNNLTVTLIEPALYHIRHMPMQGIFKNSNMQGIMAHLAANYSIENTYIQTPDNDHVYGHIVIPPYKEFKDVFHHLQERYGVYMLGFNNYFTEDELYIWPTLDTNPKAPFYVKILQADDGAYAGSPAFHNEETNGLTIVINNSPNAQDHSMISAEHRGNSAQFLRTSTQVDGIMSQDDNGLLTYNQDNVISVGLNNRRLARDDTNHSKYVHQTDNLFAVASELARDNFISMSLNWPQARPWLIKPGSAVRYYSDDNGKIGKRTGLIDSAFYMFKRGDRASVNTYTCKGLLSARLDPNEQIVNNIT